MMHLIGWDNLETSRSIKAFFELGAIVLFAVLVLFEVLAHRSSDDSGKKHLFNVLALIAFALAVLFEFLAYPYSRRVDTLADNQIRKALAAAGNSVKPKPFDERLRAFLNGVDKKILLALADGSTNFTGTVEVFRRNELETLCAEPEASNFIRLREDMMGFQVFSPGRGQVADIVFSLSTNLLKRP